MADRNKLTLALIQRRASTAARVLAALPPEDAATYLVTIPTRFAAIAVNRMNPWPAAQVLQQLDPATGAALLRELEFAASAKILRLVPAAERRHWLAELPRRLRRSFELSLSFSADSVGANMTTDIALLAESDTPAEAQEIVRRSPRHTLELIFVTDEQHRYRGVLHAVDLLRNPGHFTVADFIDYSCPALPAQARLDRVAGLDAWNEFRRLPVVSRSGELLGALPFKALRIIDSVSQPPAAWPSLTESLVSAMAVSVSGLANLVAEPRAGAANRETPRGR